MKVSPYVYPIIKGVKKFKTKATANDIIETSVRISNVPIDKLLGIGRSFRATKVRNVVILLLTKYSTLDQTERAKIFNRHRSGMVNAVNTALQLIEIDPEYKELIASIERELRRKFLLSEFRVVKLTEAYRKLRRGKPVVEPEPEKFIRIKGEYSNRQF